MIDDPLLSDLTEPQRTAVLRTDGPLLVLAGAGSGKTRVITRRAAYLASTVARPDQVLAITFTNKAAGEMRERIDALGASRGMWVCTFHSLCARLLRLYGAAVGVAPNFTIFDDADRRALLREAIADCDLRADNWQPAAVEATISDAKNRLVGPDAFAEQAHDFVGRTMARIYAKYQEMIAVQNGCDFDDLLLHTANMLVHDAALCAELSDRFRYLLIDEYQDTNHAQYVIASRLASAHHNICATGDPDQSIYGWRGADLNNILEFEAEYPDAAVIRLEQNFRSTAAILAAASSVISRNVLRKEKTLWTAGDRGPAVRVWTCEDAREEAARIASDIQAYLDGGGQGGDVAVFYRINALSRVLEDALRQAHIPYRVARGVEFYRRKEIKDALAYLRMIVNPADETSIVRAIGAPPRGIGQTTIQKVRDQATARGCTFDEAMIRMAGEKGAAAKRLKPFVELTASLRALPAQPVKPIVEAVIRQSGLEASLGGEGELNNEPLENLYELVNAAGQFDADNPDGTLTDWLQAVSLVSDADAVAEGGGPVTLMTLHTAKGLEYPVVYIVGLEEGLLPHQRSILEGERLVEEERRLCFVGMTRAMHRLTLTHALYRMVRGVEERTIGSRFLRELPEDEIEHARFERTRDRSRSHLGRYNASARLAGHDGFFPGQRVRHDEYGEGQIIGMDQRGRSVYVRIYFPEVGERAFATEHASLYVMDD